MRETADWLRYIVWTQTCFRTTSHFNAQCVARQDSRGGVTQVYGKVVAAAHPGPRCFGDPRGAGVSSGKAAAHRPVPRARGCGSEVPCVDFLNRPSFALPAV